MNKDISKRDLKMFAKNKMIYSLKPESVTQKFSLKQKPSFNKSKLSDNWGSVLKLVYKHPDIRKAICIGCGHGTLIDKNGGRYSISGFDTLEKVELIINKILEINSEQPEGNSAN